MKFLQILMEIALFALTVVELIFVSHSQSADEDYRHSYYHDHHLCSFGNI